MKRALFALVAAAVSTGSFAQAYPTKPIRLVLPTIPGSAFELMGRLMATKMGESMGQPIVAENRAGANGVLGADSVAKAAPDGYTLLWATPSQIVTARLISKSVPYDGMKDFTPITSGAAPVTVVVLNTAVPVKTVKDFVDYAKRNPGKMSYGSPGIGSLFHFTGEEIRRAAGIDIVHVPYKGPPQALNDLFGGRIEMTIVTLGTATQLAAANKLKILALLEGKRYAGAPDLPTVGETVPGFEKPASWYALFGPAALPQPIVQRLYKEMATGLKTPEVRAWLDKNLHDAGGMPPEEFTAQYRKSFEVLGKIAKEAGIQPE